MKLEEVAGTMRPGQYARRSSWPFGVYIGHHETNRNAITLSNGIPGSWWCMWYCSADDFAADDWVVQL